MASRSHPGWGCAVLIALATALAPRAATSATDLPAGVLRACTFELPVLSRHYTVGAPFDITILGLLASDLKLPLQRVAVPFERLADAVTTGQCDVALGAPPRGGVHEERLHRSPALVAAPLRALVPIGQRKLRSWDELDRPGRRLGVARGGVAEAALSGRLRHASVLVFDVAAFSLDELDSGRVDAIVMTQDFAERVADASSTVRAIALPGELGTWSIGLYAAADRPQWARRVDEFTTRVKRDGRLSRAAKAGGIGHLVVP